MLLECPRSNFDIDHFGKTDSRGFRHCAAGALHERTVKPRSRISPESVSFWRRSRQPKRFYSAVAAGWHWGVIAPGESNHEGRASITFGQPVELVFVQPHMHLRGEGHDGNRDLSVGQKPKTILSVPHYSFCYRAARILFFAKPLQLPEGSERCRLSPIGTTRPIIR